MESEKFHKSASHRYDGIKQQFRDTVREISASSSPPFHHPNAWDWVAVNTPLQNVSGKQGAGDAGGQLGQPPAQSRA